GSEHEASRHAPHRHRQRQRDPRRTPPRVRGLADHSGQRRDRSPGGQSAGGQAARGGVRLLPRRLRPRLPPRPQRGRSAHPAGARGDQDVERLRPRGRPQRRGDLRGGGENSGIGPVTAPDRVPLARGLAQFLAEGRYIEVDLADAPLTVACLYLPKGGLPAELQRPGRMREAPDAGARYTRKMGFMAAFSRYLTRTRRAAAAAGREFLLLGDLNIAHTRQDLAAWRRNQQNDGFLPE